MGDCGENVYIEAPFYANFGGHNCHFGKNIYVNYNLTCVDDTHIYVGDYTMFGPNVTIATAGSVVTKDIPSNVVAVGNPCKVMREVGEHDRKYYFRDREINMEEWKE